MIDLHIDVIEHENSKNVLLEVSSSEFVEMVAEMFWTRGACNKSVWFKNLREPQAPNQWKLRNPDYIKFLK